MARCSAISIPHMPEVGERVPVSRCTREEHEDDRHEVAFDHDSLFDSDDEHGPSGDTPDDSIRTSP